MPIARPSTDPISTSVSPWLVPVPPSGILSAVAASVVVPAVSRAAITMGSTLKSLSRAALASRSSLISCAGTLQFLRPRCRVSAHLLHAGAGTWTSNSGRVHGPPVAAELHGRHACEKARGIGFMVS